MREVKGGPEGEVKGAGPEETSEGDGKAQGDNREVVVDTFGGINIPTTALPVDVAPSSPPPNPPPTPSARASSATTVPLACGP